MLWKRRWLITNFLLLIFSILLTISFFTLACATEYLEWQLTCMSVVRRSWSCKRHSSAAVAVVGWAYSCGGSCLTLHLPRRHPVALPSSWSATCCCRGSWRPRHCCQRHRLQLGPSVAAACTCHSLKRHREPREHGRLLHVRADNVKW